MVAAGGGGRGVEGGQWDGGSLLVGGYWLLFGCAFGYYRSPWSEQPARFWVFCMCGVLPCVFISPSCGERVRCGSPCVMPCVRVLR